MSWNLSYMRHNNLQILLNTNLVVGVPGLSARSTAMDSCCCLLAAGLHIRGLPLPLSGSLAARLACYLTNLETQQHDKL